MTEYKGIALDIGTTNVVAALVTGGDCAKTEILLKNGCVNGQVTFAPDLVGRISAAELDYAALRGALLDSVNRAVSGLCAAAGVSPVGLPTVAVGNTLMSSFFVGLSVEGLGKSPFTPPSLFGEELAIEGYVGGSAYIAPAMGSFVGGDVAAGVYRFAPEEDGVLFIDAGTNGEVYGCYRGKRLACSAAAGPALEVGTGAAAMEERAVTAYRKEGKLCAATRDGRPFSALAGSGVIELVALMIGKECDERGHIENGGVVLEGGVAFTDRHMGEFQLAKAAIAAATLCVMRGLGMPPTAIRRFCVSGAMGSAVSRGALVKTGLVPSYAAGKIELLGNSALLGCVPLFDAAEREKIAALCRSTSVLPLDKSEYFKERFAEELFFYE